MEWIEVPKITETEWLLRKKKIIDTAINMFSVLGYSKVSVNDIVREAKISKGGFYTYFDSKKQIFFEILGEIDKNRMSMIMLNDESVSATTLLKDYIKSRLESYKNEENQKRVKFSIEFWATIERNDGIRVINEQRYKAYHNQLSDLVKFGIAKGEFRDNIDIDATVFSIISLMDGIAFMVSVMNQSLDYMKIETSINMLINYLKNL